MITWNSPALLLQGCRLEAIQQRFTDDWKSPGRNTRGVLSSFFSVGCPSPSRGAGGHPESDHPSDCQSDQPPTPAHPLLVLTLWTHILPKCPLSFIWAVLTIHEGLNFKAETENASKTPRFIIISQEIWTLVFLLETHHHEAVFGGSWARQREFTAAIGVRSSLGRCPSLHVINTRPALCKGQMLH